jgi:hypothetical protein
VSSKYRPCSVAELEDRPSLIGAPLPPDNVISLPKARSLRAVLAENLNAIRALRRHLEDGVTVQNDAQCEIVKLLFVATQHQEKALTACLELDGLE